MAANKSGATGGSGRRAIRREQRGLARAERRINAVAATLRNEQELNISMLFPGMYVINERGEPFKVVKRDNGRQTVTLAPILSSYIGTSRSQRVLGTLEVGSRTERRSFQNIQKFRLTTRARIASGYRALEYRSAVRDRQYERQTRTFR